VWIVKLLRYDPVMASAGLIGMSHSLATYGHNRVLQKKRVQDALRFRELP
jgi:hypothetical protein